MLLRSLVGYWHRDAVRLRPVGLSVRLSVTMCIVVVRVGVEHDGEKLHCRCVVT